MFTAVLFTMAETWKQLKRPLTDGWIEKSWYVCIVFSHKKKKEWNPATCNNVAGTRGHYLSEIRATERPIPNPLMGEIPSPRNKTKIKVIGQRTDWWLPETGGREGVRVGEHAGLSCWCGSDATLLMRGHLLSLLQFSSCWGRRGAWSPGGFYNNPPVWLSEILPSLEP